MTDPLERETDSVLGRTAIAERGRPKSSRCQIERAVRTA
jgi:hypothetical protein